MWPLMCPVVARKNHLSSVVIASLRCHAGISQFPPIAAKRVRTAKELEDIEHQNLIAALESTDWKIAGSNGAAQLLGLKPTTLSSRMKAPGIERKR